MKLIPQDNVKTLGRKGAVAVLLMEVGAACWLALLALDAAKAGDNFGALLAFLGSILAFFGAANGVEHMAKRGAKPGDQAEG